MDHTERLHPCTTPSRNLAPYLSGHRLGTLLKTNRGTIYISPILRWGLQSTGSPLVSQPETTTLPSPSSAHRTGGATNPKQAVLLVLPSSLFFCVAGSMIYCFCLLNCTRRNSSWNSFWMLLWAMYWRRNSIP